MLLGIGGRGANGNFVAAEGTPGIRVSPPLHGGQRLFAVDVCAELTSALFAIVTGTVPIMSPVVLLALALLLAAAGGVRVMRRAR